MDNRTLYLLLVNLFELRGEEVHRRSSGRLVKGPSLGRYGEVYVYKRDDGRKYKIGYHRLKYALHNGWLPPVVDHEDRDHTNNRLSNLRASTKGHNYHNSRSRPRKHNLPRCVNHNKKGFSASVKFGGETIHLGTFKTPEIASEVAEARLKELYGELYSPP